MKAIEKTKGTVSRIPKLRIFNPGRLSDEELELTFIARQTVFHEIIDHILSEQPGHVPQHHLLVGQRGMGKTTLLCRIASELRKDAHNKQFIPLQFPEEQYVEVDRYSKFWLNCLDSLADALESENHREGTERLDQEIAELASSKEPEPILADQCRAHFEKVVDVLGRRPVLLFDNFNLLLNRLKDEDYALRSFFMREDAPILIGAATSLPDADDYNAAFYNALMIRALRRLSLKEMREVLIRLAKASDRPGLVAQIQMETPRLSVLRDLTGGNPRTTVLLFELFNRGFSDEAYEDLESLLDHVTPLYQSRLDQLSDQSQLVLGTLAQHWSPATSLKLGELCGLVQGSISSQLNRLEANGLVEKTERSKGKKPGYQLAERFFNIWYLMRFAPRRQRNRLLCLTRFLEAFYSQNERLNQANAFREKTQLSTSELTYAMALTGTNLNPSISSELKTQAGLQLIQECEGIRERIAEIVDPEDIPAKVYEFGELKLKLREAAERANLDDPKKFVDLVISSPFLLPPTKLDRNMIPNYNNETINKLWSALKEEVHFKTPDPIEFFKHRCRRGLWTRLDDEEEANRAVEAANKVFICIGIGLLIRHNLPRISRRAYQKGIELGLNDFDDLTIVVGLIKDLGDLKGAEAASRKALSIKPTPELYDKLGNILQEMGQGEESETAYRKALELDPDNSGTWNNLGCVLRVPLGRLVEAEKAFRKSIEINKTDANPWHNLGNLFLDIQKPEEAEHAFKHAAKIDPSPLRLNWLGIFLNDHRGKIKEAREAHLRVLQEFPDDISAARYLLFSDRDFSGKIESARETLAAWPSENSEELQQDPIQLTLFATAEKNWGQASNHLRKAIQERWEQHDPINSNDWYRTFSIIIHQGYGPQLIGLLEQENWQIEVLPWFEAIRAHVKEDRRHLLDIPQEARAVASKIYDDIALRRQWLPESTRNLAKR